MKKILTVCLVLVVALGGFWWLSRTSCPEKPAAPMPNQPSDPAQVVRPPIPMSKLPGPPRTTPPWTFILDNSNSKRAKGMDDPLTERWSDIAGNHYSTDLVRQFSYTGTAPRDSQLRIRVEPEGETLQGRLEAQGLKPNFAYQIKLRGIFRDRRAFEAIGYAGRWRLPGWGTNYTDADYQSYFMQDQVEAYILFDFFITDSKGDAVRDFALDSSLHVLWNLRQITNALPEDVVTTVMDTSDPEIYTRPKKASPTQSIFAEREHIRYQTADQITRLPPGTYEAEIVLTEESFHANSPDDGFWATVYQLPVTFTIRSPGLTQSPALKDQQQEDRSPY